MGSRTTPLPMMPLQPGRKTPQGISCSTNFWLPMNDRMSGVVPARVARHGAEALAQHVHNFALALVAPLGAQHNCRLRSHSCPLP